MKLRQIAFILFCSIIVLSCTTVPEPENDTDSLVVGSFTMDFVDGFFNLPPRVVENNIWIGVRDLRTGQDFRVKTNGGFFNFLGKSDHEYAILYIESELERFGGIYTFGSNVGYQFSVPARSIAYIGHWRLVYMSPDKDRERERESTWNFDKDLQRSNKQSTVLEYIHEIDTELIWDSYSVKSVGFDQ